MTTEQQEDMQAYVERGYETFVTRCSSGRNIPVDSIKQIAEGRVWDGKSAMDLGLVDEMGGLNQAIGDMAKKLGMSVNDVKEYPVIEYGIISQLLSSTNVAVCQQFEIEGFSKLAKYLDAIKFIKQIEPLQCRMEEIIIQ